MLALLYSMSQHLTSLSSEQENMYGCRSLTASPVTCGRTALSSISARMSGLSLGPQPKSGSQGTLHMYNACLSHKMYPQAGHDADSTLTARETTLQPLLKGKYVAAMTDSGAGLPARCALSA